MKLETVVLNRERNVTLRAYLLDTPADYENIDKRPAVLVLPGGAYMRCSNREAEPVAMAFLAEGYNAYILNYSVMEHAEFPHPLEDADQAMALIRQKAEDWNTDPGKAAKLAAAQAAEPEVDESRVDDILAQVQAMFAQGND